MKTDPQAFADPSDDWIEQQAICMKWISVLGVSLDIDLPAAEYFPPFSGPDMCAAYDADMKRLHSLKGDPYEALYEAAFQSNLI